MSYASPTGEIWLQSRPGYAPHAARAGVARCGLGFLLFVLLNATLYIRPAEIVPALLGLEIYQTLIIACLAASFTCVLEQLTPSELERRPITVCVIGLAFAVAMSHLANVYMTAAAQWGWDFVKVVLYYLLLVGLLHSPGRIRQFLFWLTIFCLGMTILAVLEYHEVISLPNLSALKEGQKDQISGKEVFIQRLRSSGIFRDPNDTCVMLAAAVPLCLYWFTDPRSGLLRFVWVAPLGLIGYAIALTHSRGGFLAALVGVLVILRTRWGWAKTLGISAILLPVVFVLFAGRQTSISAVEGTGQDRIQIWSAGMVLFRDHPLFGVGRERYAEFVNYVAHNSYLHCFGELGLFGGVLFLGAFYVALSGLFRLGSPRYQILDPELRRMRPYLTGMLAAYATGMLSLTLSYLLPTYTMLGLAASYLHLAKTDPPLPQARFGPRLLGRMFAVSLCFLAALYVFIRLFQRSG